MNKQSEHNTQRPLHDTDIITGDSNATIGDDSWEATYYMMNAMVWSASHKFCNAPTRDDWLNVTST